MTCINCTQMSNDESYSWHLTRRKATALLWGTGNFSRFAAGCRWRGNWRSGMIGPYCMRDIMPSAHNPGSHAATCFHFPQLLTRSLCVLRRMVQGRSLMLNHNSLVTWYYHRIALRTTLQDNLPRSVTTAPTKLRRWREKKVPQVQYGLVPTFAWFLSYMLSLHKRCKYITNVLAKEKLMTIFFKILRVVPLKTPLIKDWLNCGCRLNTCNPEIAYLVFCPPLSIHLHEAYKKKTPVHEAKTSISRRL